jgi:hypothetical protein
MRRLIGTMLALTLAVSACTTEPTAREVPIPGVFAAGALQPLGGCDALLAWYVDHAVDLVGPYGLPGPWGPIVFAEDMARNVGGVPAESATTTAPAADGSFTGTNVQVEGVDEADLVKTDGTRIFTLVDGVLRVSMVAQDGVRHAGSIRFEDGTWYSDMLLRGDTVVLVGGAWGPAVPASADRIAPIPTGSPTILVAQVDVSDPDRPEVVRTLQADGSYVGARLVDGALRLALTSGPVGFEWATPEGSGLRAEREAIEKNQAIIRRSTIDNWLPFHVLADHRSDTESEGLLVDCETVLAPLTFSGLDTLSVLSIDLDDGIGEWAGAGVAASGQTIYATADHLYVATQPWTEWWGFTEDEARDAARSQRTQIHFFDTSDPGAPVYVASGSVPGFLLNQFSMDEHEGHLRVASTTAPDGWWWTEESESLVTVLRRVGANLVEVGQVDGLGPGERIFAVRFMGDLGYVVTFRQTDPLYTLDLADPTAPEAVGELKILGYSAYLHPAGDGRLLGLGQDADEEGRTKGTQLSLFDVTDPADPARLDQVGMEDAWSQAEGDHHAFTFLDGLALAPFESWQWLERAGSDGEERFDAGVMAIRVEGDRLVLESILRVEAEGPMTGKDIWTGEPHRQVPLRTIVIGDRIFTVTSGGIAVHDAATFERLVYERF